MRTARRDTTCRRTRLVLVAGALLLAGCGAPYAWNEYLTPGYSQGRGPLPSPSSVPAEVTGSFGTISPDELRSIVAEGIHAPVVFRATADAAPQQGASTQDEPPTRTVWTFSGTPTPGGAGTNVRIQARYYSDNTLISTAAGTTVIKNGSDDPLLRELVADVAGQFFPEVPRGGGGPR
jgi:hypothetical protein